MRVGDVCHRDPVTTSAEECVRRAAELMRLHHIGDVIVLGSGDGRELPVGLVTDRDLVLQVLEPGLDPELTALGEVMSQPVITLDEGEDLEHALMRLQAAGVRRAPVVDTAGRLAGILVLEDVIDVLAHQLGMVSSLFGREQTREAKRWPSGGEAPAAGGGIAAGMVHGAL